MAANALLTVNGITCPRRPPDYPEIVTFFSTLAGTSANWRGAFGLPLPVHVGRPLQPPPDAMLLLLEPLCLRTAGAPQPGLSTGKGHALYVRATYLRPANFSGASRLSSAQSSLTRTSRNQTEVLPTSRPLPVGGGESCRGGIVRSPISHLGWTLGFGQTSSGTSGRLVRLIQVDLVPGYGARPGDCPSIQRSGKKNGIQWNKNRDVGNYTFDASGSPPDGEKQFASDRRGAYARCGSWR